MNQQTSTKSDTLKSALTRLIKGETEVLDDPQIIDALPAVVKQLIAKGNLKTAQALVRRLLDRLGQSSQREDRSRIVEALAGIGPPAIPVIGNRMTPDAPWYFLRNLILLLGRIGDERHLELLQPMLTHEDFRIQREALSALYLIGDDQRGELLLARLKDAKDPTKILIVSMLGRLGYGPATPVLSELLQASRKKALGSVRERLQERICGALGSIGDPSAQPALESVIKASRDDLPPFSQSVRDAARKAVMILAKRQKEPLPKEDEKPDATAATKDRTDGFEQELSCHLDQGDTEAAVGLIFQAIVAAAQAKNFSRAEALRERLFDVDAMALSEIIKAGEIIEAEKSESLDRDHLDLWPDLYETLSDEEANALFFAMTEEVFEPNDILLAQGEKNDRLFFVNQGLIKAIFRQGNHETLLKDMGKGTIAGHRTFFGISVCTISLIAQTRVKASVLKREAMDGWQTATPALASKLENYCLKMVKTKDLVRGKGVDRRTQKRVDIHGKANILLISPSGKTTGKPFRGDLADISVGGLSFLIRSSKQDTVRLLLGRAISIGFGLKTRNGVHRLDEKAEIIGIHYLQENEYSLHVRFMDLLDEKLIASMDRDAETAA